MERVYRMTMTHIHAVAEADPAALPSNDSKAWWVTVVAEFVDVNESTFEGSLPLGFFSSNRFDWQTNRRRSKRKGPTTGIDGMFASVQPTTVTGDVDAKWPSVHTVTWPALIGWGADGSVVTGSTPLPSRRGTSNAESLLFFSFSCGYT